METEIINGVLISIVAAAFLGYIVHLLRQPVIFGYIIAGILIGPQLGLEWVTEPEVIDFSSELGLIALLFMVGLELNLGKIRRFGKSLLITAVLQFALCVALGLAFFNLPGFDDGGKYAALYLSITFALSSTMIVVKILYDKFELDTLPGRLTLGVLVLQDIWAIIFLTIQPDLANPEVYKLALSMLKGAALIAGCVLASRFVLPIVFRGIAKSPELVLVTALGWCFLISWISGDVAELSRAMGALIAGISLSAFPYRQEISDRVTSIRSFFLILFFVSLGMKVDEPSTHNIIMSLLASLFLIASRFITVFPPLYFMRKGIRVSFLVPLNLAQISEFSLVIVAIGVDFGHVNANVMTIVEQIEKIIKVLVADDHTMVRDGICAVLALQKDMAVVGEAGNGKEALDKLSRLMPDVALLDIMMPVMSGVQATKEIVKQYPQTRVLILTQYDEEENMQVCAEAGALGFIPKKAASTQLVDGVRAVYNGTYFPMDFEKMVMSK